MTLRAQMVLSLRDRLSEPLKRVRRSMADVVGEGRALRRELGAAGRRASDFSAAQRRSATATLQAARSQAHMINEFRRLKTASQGTRAQLRGTQEQLAALAREGKTTSAQFRRLRGDAARLKTDLNTQQTGLEQVRRRLHRAGVSTRDLASANRAATNAIRAATAEVSAQDAALQRLERRHRAAGRLEERYRNRRDARLALAAGMGVAGVGGLVAGRQMARPLQSTIGEAIGFEAVFADVEKVADFKSEADARAYKGQLLDMSRVIAVDQAGLATIAAEALQAGIPREDSLRFTGFTAKSSVAFDMAAFEAGESFAKVRNNFQLTQEQLELTADATNHLSNNMAAKAPEIIDFLRRAAGAAPGLGQNAREMAALGASFVALGTQAEIGARAVNALSINVHAGGTAVDEAFDHLGMDRKAFSGRLKVEGADAMFELLDRIAASDNRDFALSKLVGRDFSDDFGKLLNNLDLLRTAYGLVANAQDYAGSVSEEYTKRAATTEGALQLLDNKWRAMKISIGSVVLPTIVEIVDTMGAAVDRITGWAEAHPGLTKGLIYAGAAIAGLTFFGGGLLVAMGGLIATTATLGFGLKMLGLRAAVSAGGLGLIGRIFAALGRVRPLRWAALVPKLAWSAFVTPLKWAMVVPRLFWRALVPVLKWGGLVAKIPWATAAGKLSWLALVTPLKWGARLIPVIGWGLLAGELAWSLLIEPLGWDKYLTDIDWSAVTSALSWDGLLTALEWATWLSPIRWLDWIPGFSWAEVLKEVQALDWSALIPDVPDLGTQIKAAVGDIDLASAGREAIQSLIDGAKAKFEEMRAWLASLPQKVLTAIGSIDLSNIISWPKMPNWLGGSAATEAKASAPPKPANTNVAPGLIGAAKTVDGFARGGTVPAAGPILVGERGPELRYASKGEFIAHHGQLRDLVRMARRIFPANDDAAPVTTVPAPPILPRMAAAGALATAPQAQAGTAPQTGARAVTFNNTFHITGSDPDAIARKVAEIMERQSRRRMSD